MHPVLLALSTFRRSEEAVRRAIRLACDGRTRLDVALVVDVDLARYLIGSDVLVGTRLRKTCEEDLLDRHRQEAKEGVASIQRAAEEAGVECSAVVVTGRFAVEVLQIVRSNSPKMVVTTRSERPEWVRRLFGSPVDQLVSQAPCPVLLT